MLSIKICLLLVANQKLILEKFNSNKLLLKLQEFDRSMSAIGTRQIRRNELVLKCAKYGITRQYRFENALKRTWN